MTGQKWPAFLMEVDSLNSSKLTDIEARIYDKPYLHLAETSVLSIPERLEQYDPNMFICFNCLLQEYEVHSLRNRGDTHSLSIPWPDLDQRTLDLVARRDLNRRPLRAIIKEIDDHNDAIERDRQRQRSRDLNAIAREVRPIFRDFAEEKGLRRVDCSEEGI